MTYIILQVEVDLLVSNIMLGNIVTPSVCVCGGGGGPRYFHEDNDIHSRFTENYKSSSRGKMSYLITFHDKNDILITVHDKYKKPITVHENTPFWSSPMVPIQAHYL